MGRYVVQAIKNIPAADVAESVKEGYPTVLVIGKRPYLPQVVDAVKAEFADVQAGGSQTPEVDPLHGYVRLATNPRSRLGWRIIMFKYSSPEAEAKLASVLAAKSELADVLPEPYRAKHLRIAGLVGRLVANQTLTAEETTALEGDLGRSLDEIQRVLGILVKEPEEDQADPAAQPATVDETKPTIVCTSVVGSKGLSAGHVFLVGCNNGSLPRNPASISDDEVCSFLVALSRTRKECHLVSSQRFAGIPTTPSDFIDWIQGEATYVSVNAHYWQAEH